MSSLPLAPESGLLRVVRRTVEVDDHRRVIADDNGVVWRRFGVTSQEYYVILDGGGYGEQAFPFPIYGSETVLDAISNVNGLHAVASKRNIWVARRTPHPGDRRSTVVELLPAGREVAEACVDRFGKALLELARPRTHRVRPRERVAFFLVTLAPSAASTPSSRSIPNTLSRSAASSMWPVPSASVLSRFPAAVASATSSR